MLCDVCKENQATITIKKIVNGVHSEIHLCERCARSEDMKLTGKFDLSEFVKNILEMQSGYQLPFNLKNPDHEPPIDAPGVRYDKCPNCQMSFNEFRKTAKLGCEKCYESFDDVLEPIIKRMHGKTVHTGKAAHTAGEEILKKREISDIQIQLLKAVDEENYELAAEYRDMIKMLKSSSDIEDGDGLE